MGRCEGNVRSVKKARENEGDMSREGEGNRMGWDGMCGDEWRIGGGESAEGWD